MIKWKPNRQRWPCLGLDLLFPLPPFSWSLLVFDLLFFLARPLPPLSFSPSASEASFAMCPVSQLTSLLLSFPPLQQVSPRLQCATDPSSPTCSYLFLPSSW